MEAFRPIIAASAAIQAINNGEVRPTDFVTAGGRVALTPDDRRAELIALLHGILHHDHHHVPMVDIGPAENIQPRLTSLGKTFEVLERGPVIV